MSNENLTMLYEMSKDMTKEQFDFFVFCLKSLIDGTLDLSAEGIEKKHIEYLDCFNKAVA